MINVPGSLMDNYDNGAELKTKKSIPVILVAAMLAGAFIAFGASSSNTAVYDLDNIGLARTLAGCIFPVGLMLIVLVGGELFTGNCMMISGCVRGRFSAGKLVKVLCLVWLGNMVGSVLMAAIAYGAGQWNYGGGALGAYTIKVAMGKCNLPFMTALLSGILCNVLVCAAVLMAGAAKDAVGKIFGCFFPILAFVCAGYEHCVANMYYIPAGIMAATNDTYVAKATELYGYTAEQLASVNVQNFFVANLLPVTIGNILGGMVFVALPLIFIHKKAN